jgi:hypothetical protein
LKNGGFFLEEEGILMFARTGFLILALALLVAPSAQGLTIQEWFDTPQVVGDKTFTLNSLDTIGAATTVEFSESAGVFGFTLPSALSTGSTTTLVFDFTVEITSGSLTLDTVEIATNSVGWSLASTALPSSPETSTGAPASISLNPGLTTADFVWSLNDSGPGTTGRTCFGCTVGFTQVPEPSTALLVAVGITGLAAAERRRSRH